jgi:hypothetical protein
MAASRWRAAYVAKYASWLPRRADQHFSMSPVQLAAGNLAIRAKLVRSSIA